MEVAGRGGQKGRRGRGAAANAAPGPARRPRNTCGAVDPGARRPTWPPPVSCPRDRVTRLPAGAAAAGPGALASRRRAVRARADELGDQAAAAPEAGGIARA